MPITWRPATWKDIALGLAIQPRNLGCALIGEKAALEEWRRLAETPFFASAALLASPPIQGHRLIGFGASVMVSPSFVDAEMASPRPDINSRVMANLHAGKPVLATRSEVAQGNAGKGVDLIILYGCCWRYELLHAEQSEEAVNLLATSFTEWHAGYRINRILSEAADATSSEYMRRSIVYQAVQEFAEQGRVLYAMTHASVQAVSGSLGNVLFSYREPRLHLRASDQQLLVAALNGATDLELAAELEVTLSAVKARWRSILARVEDALPALVRDESARERRGQQKRHRVLAYVRGHPEELRPFDWAGKDGRYRGSEEKQIPSLRCGMTNTGRWGMTNN